MRGFAGTAALSLTLAWSALAQSPNYEALLDRDGRITTEAQHAAAIALVKDARQLEAVYSDVARGDPRARHVWQELEASMAGAGVAVAERATRAGCLVPGYKELQMECRPDWSFLDFLSKENPGALQLRRVIFSAFAERAHERGLENKLILATVNGLLAVGVAATVLREAEAAATAGAARVNKVGPHPEAQGPHTSYKRDPTTGKVSGYTEFDASGNPVKRFRGEGMPHGGKEPPLVLEPKPGKGPGAPPKVPREPRPDELPKGYADE